MAEPERTSLGFPGFLRSADGGYLTVEGFLTFVAGASSAKGDTKERALAWLQRQGITGPVEALSPAEVSRLIEAAKKAIVAKKGREKRELPRPEEMLRPSGDAGEDMPSEEPE